MLALPCWLHQHFLFLIQAQVFKKKIKIKIRGLLPIKCFRQVYASACSAHNVGDSELSPMEDLC